MIDRFKLYLAGRHHHHTLSESNLTRRLSLTSTAEEKDTRTILIFEELVAVIELYKEHEEEDK